MTAEPSKSGKSAWIRRLGRHLDRFAPSIETASDGVPRRQYADYENVRDANAFTVVHVYAESGLASRRKAFIHIADTLFKVQLGEIDHYTVRTRVIATDAAAPKHASNAGSVCNRGMVRGELERLAVIMSGDTPLEGKSALTKLVPRPQPGHLVLIICKSPGSVVVSQDGARALRRLRKTAVWVYLDGDEPTFETEVDRRKREAKGPTEEKA